MRLGPAFEAVRSAEPLPVLGRVIGVVGLVIEAQGPRASIGELCYISPSPSSPQHELRAAEVVGFRRGLVLLMPLGTLEGIQPGWLVRATGGPLPAPVGSSLLGRVLDGLGRPIDGKGPLHTTMTYPAQSAPPDPMRRKRIERPLSVGVRAIDALLTCGRGQRLGIFAGSGVGKSSLMGMIARGTEADVNVICLVGERGREVREFLDHALGEEGLARSVLVVATSDQPALIRIKAALVATAVAEYFRDSGQDVLLMMDSVTRLAMAQREVGLAVGEPPATRGYTPSVFTLLPQLLERSGAGHKGTITGIYTVLVDGDDMNEPIADAVRGILDGHAVLSRRLAHQNHFPALDVLESVSRVMPYITDPAHRTAVGTFRSLLATYREAEDLVTIGAYQRGTQAALDRALDMLPDLYAFLQQGMDEPAPYNESVQRLLNLCGNQGETPLEPDGSAHQDRAAV